MTTLQPQTGERSPLSQAPSSPVITTSSQSSPVMERNVQMPTLAPETDWLGLNYEEAPPIVATSNDDDTAPSSSDETPVYNIEGEIPDLDDGIYDEADVRPLLYGYLDKLGRNGKWQRRFFETDGESLSYYKSEARSKMLATLDLNKVGSIAMSSEDASGCTFHIIVADRPYTLKCDTKQKCIDWVITLNRIKEARMQLGGVKLVTPKFTHSATLRQESVDVAPRVVLAANRQRTRAVDDSQTLKQMMETQIAVEHRRVPSRVAYETLTSSMRDSLAVWEKPGPLQKVKKRLLDWARSIKKIAADCTTPQQHVVLDTHLHPPGHDDVPMRGKSVGSQRSRPQSHARTFVPVGEDGETRQLA